MAGKSSGRGRVVYLVDGARTPFIKAKQGPNFFSPGDLAVASAAGLGLKYPEAFAAMDEVVFGCVNVSADETNVGRVISLRLGIDQRKPAWTVQRNCASGLQAIDSAYKDILLGHADMVLCGGTEAMSHAPLYWTPELTTWFARFAAAKTATAKLKSFATLRPKYFKPVIALLRGLTDPVSGLSMGQTAEELAFRFEITREQMDEFAKDSHHRALTATEQGHFSEIVPIYDDRGHCYDADDGIRPENALTKLTTLSPVFDKKFGKVTAGNSSQITDGASTLLLASEEAVTQYGFSPLAKISGIAWAGLAPEVMGLGPVHAIANLLEQTGVAFDKIDCFEINEAFAAQVLACQKALSCPVYAKEQLDWEHPVGDIDPKRLNMDGGAIALGHPVGASGARISLHLAKILERESFDRGIASLCIGGGQGGAILLERAA